MDDQIKLTDIKNNPLFWFFYIGLFRGYDEKNEINLDEVLEEIYLNREGLIEWEKNFFSKNLVRFIGDDLSEQMSFYIEFQENEVIYFLNDLYIGNLGGHFEAWFLTLDELIKFEDYDMLFLLLLPMVGIEKKQVEYAKELITKQLKSIPKFDEKSEYIAECIVNGLVMDEEFYITEVGVINNQNNSVRNINKYNRYRDNIIELNLGLNHFIEEADD